MSYVPLVIGPSDGKTKSIELTGEQASEVKSVAEWCARRGIVPNVGDPLPPLMSGTCYFWIDENLPRFQALVRKLQETA